MRKKKVMGTWYEEPLEQQKVPCPCMSSLKKSPSQREVSRKMWTPRPFRWSLTHDPWYFSPFEYTYRGTSLIRNSPPPQDHHRALGISVVRGRCTGRSPTTRGTSRRLSTPIPGNQFSKTNFQNKFTIVKINLFILVWTKMNKFIFIYTYSREPI